MKLEFCVRMSCRKDHGPITGKVNVGKPGSKAKYRGKFEENCQNSFRSSAGRESRHDESAIHGDHLGSSEKQGLKTLSR